jgi:outer membrane protein assembly factor BamB
VTATQIYFTKDMQNHHGGYVLVGDHIYGVSDPRMLTCLNFKTGETVWQNPSVGKGSVAYADGHLYVRSERGGTMALVQATPTGYVEKGRFEQPTRSGKTTWPHPVIANGHLLLRDHDVLFRYKVKQ